MNAQSQPKPWFEIRNGLLVAGEYRICLDAISHYFQNADQVTINFIGGKSLVVFGNPTGVATGAAQLVAALDEAIAGPAKKGATK